MARLYLSDAEMKAVNRFKPHYLTAERKTGVPWRLLAAMHYRENSLSVSAAQHGPFQLVDLRGNPARVAAYARAAGYPTNPVPNYETNFEFGCVCAALFVQDKMSKEARKPKLTPQSGRDALAEAAFRYNGMSQAYANPATGRPDYRFSPYVSNDPKKGVVLTIREGSVVVKDARPGVLAVIRDLGGETDEAPTPTPEEPAGTGLVFYPLSLWADMRLGSAFLQDGYGEKVRGRPDQHPGADFNLVGGAYGPAGPDADLGEPIYAVADGVVLFSGWNQYDWGNIILIDHPHLGVHTQYAHCQEREVVEGQLILAGQRIGTVGKGAAGFDAHLHFEVRRRASNLPAAKWPGNDVAFIQAHYFEPLAWLRANNARDVAKDLPALDPRLQKILDRLRAEVPKATGGAVKLLRTYVPALQTRIMAAPGGGDAAYKSPHNVRPALAFDYALIVDGKTLPSGHPEYGRWNKRVEALGGLPGTKVKGGVPGEKELDRHVELPGTQAEIKRRVDAARAGLRDVRDPGLGTNAEGSEESTAPAENRSPCPQ